MHTTENRNGAFDNKMAVKLKSFHAVWQTGSIHAEKTFHLIQANMPQPTQYQEIGINLQLKARYRALKIVKPFEHNMRCLFHCYSAEI